MTLTIHLHEGLQTMENKTTARYHVEKCYIDSPRKLGEIDLIQIGRTHCTQDYAIHHHLHRNWFELTYIIDGTGHIITNNIAVPIRAGEIYLSFPGDIHAITTDREHPIKFQFLSFWTENETILQRFDEIMLYNIDPEKRIFIDKDVEYLIGNILAEALLDDEHSEEILTCSLKQIARYIIRSFSGEKKNKLSFSSSEELCYQLIHYINTHIYVMEGLEDLAQHFGYSYSYLSDLFRKTTGDTLIKYYSARRLDAAAMLLKEDTLSVSAIAELLRYSSIYTFSRAFKKRFGYSPREQRKMN